MVTENVKRWLVVFCLACFVAIYYLEFVYEPWEFHAEEVDGGTVTYWEDAEGIYWSAFFDRVLSDREICEIKICGFDGTADGNERSKHYGTDDCNCSHVECCTESETK